MLSSWGSRVTRLRSDVMVATTPSRRMLVSAVRLGRLGSREHSHLDVAVERQPAVLAVWNCFFHASAPLPERRQVLRYEAPFPRLESPSSYHARPSAHLQKMSWTSSKRKSSRLSATQHVPRPVGLGLRELTECGLEPLWSPS